MRWRAIGIYVVMLWQLTWVGSAPIFCLIPTGVLFGKIREDSRVEQAGADVQPSI